jgi:pyruvate-formate lyase
MNKNHRLSREIKFTEVYRAYKNDHPAIREAMCLKVLFPDTLVDIEDGDLFAGRTLRMEWGGVGFSPDITIYSNPTGMGYFYRRDVFAAELEKQELDDDYKVKVKDAMEFWRTENTTSKVKAAFTDRIIRALPSDSFAGDVGIGFPLYRMTGAYENYEKLVNLGLPGMYEEVELYRSRAEKKVGDVQFFEGMKLALDILKGSCLYYQKQALVMFETTQNASRKKVLLEMAAALENITVSKPQTMREAIQLSWLYSILAGVMDYGRMDLYLGDFLANDIKKNILNEEKALSLLQSFWKLMVARKTIYHGRVVIGGKGRRNEENADKFAMLAMEASRTVNEIEPQLTLRFYKGMNPALMDKALEVIGEGRTYPMLYNDDVNVEAVKKAFNVDEAIAEQYMPFGCGEYIIDHKSFGSPNGVINVLKALEVTLNNGREVIYGRDMGIRLGEFKDFKTFEEFYAAFKKQVEYHIEILAEQEALLYKEIGQITPFLFMSMLYDDCLEKEKGMFSGGLDFLGGTLESYGNTNTVDSLVAIKELVYDKKLLTQEEMLKALQVNFEGYEKERRLMLNAPKYGNDYDAADCIAMDFHNFMSETIRKQAERVNLHSYLMVIINNSANTYLGRWTGASADGRKSGEFMANANNPSGGADKNGITAMLNSLVKLDPSYHAGAVQNMKFSSDLFNHSREKLRYLLDTYFEKGGTQAMISVLNRNDLERALAEPEKYRHVFVRVGGFSARFVDLEKDVQQEILSRTLY